MSEPGGEIKIAAAAGVNGDGSAFFRLGVLGVDGGSGGLLVTDATTSGSLETVSLSLFCSPPFFELLEMTGDVFDFVAD